MPFFLVSSIFCAISQCFYLAHVSDVLSCFRAVGELCIWLQFGIKSGGQHEFCNYMTFWFCFEITNLEKLSRLQKSMQNYPASKDVNWIRSTPLLTWWKCGLRCFCVNSWLWNLSTVFWSYQTSSCLVKTFTAIYEYVMIYDAHEIACSNLWPQLF